jgi:hypothetical protein
MDNESLYEFNPSHDPNPAPEFHKHVADMGRLPIPQLIFRIRNPGNGGSDFRSREHIVNPFTFLGVPTTERGLYILQSIAFIITTPHRYARNIRRRPIRR